TARNSSLCVNNSNKPRRALRTGNDASTTPWFWTRTTRPSSPPPPRPKASVCQPVEARRGEMDVARMGIRVVIGAGAEGADDLRRLERVRLWRSHAAREDQGNTGFVDQDRVGLIDEG